MNRYLYPARKRLEILSAVFAGGFGINMTWPNISACPLCRSAHLSGSL